MRRSWKARHAMLLACSVALAVLADRAAPARGPGGGEPRRFEARLIGWEHRNNNPRGSSSVWEFTWRSSTGHLEDLRGVRFRVVSRHDPQEIPDGVLWHAPDGFSAPSRKNPQHYGLGDWRGFEGRGLFRVPVTAQKPYRDGSGYVTEYEFQWSAPWSGGWVSVRGPHASVTDRRWLEDRGSHWVYHFSFLGRHEVLSIPKTRERH
jgi:hypothetical protein